MAALTAQGKSTLASLVPARWPQIGSLGALFASLGLLLLAALFDPRESRYASALLPTLLVAILLSVLLASRALWQLRKQHGREEHALREADSRFLSLFEKVPEGILILDREGFCLELNPAAESILGLARNELIGQELFDLLVGAKRLGEKSRSPFQGPPRPGRLSLHAAERTQSKFEVSAAMDYLPGRHLLILSDLTERTTALRSLQQSRDRFEQMASYIHEAFWVAELQTGRVTFVNPAYQALTGHSVESLLADPSSCRELLHPEDRLGVLSKLRTALGPQGFEEEFRFFRADGAVRWARVNCFPVCSDGQARWLVGTAQDITAGKEAELQNRAARAEAEALRHSTLALSQNLAMDSVLDTLLQCIAELVPFDRGAVLFMEEGGELIVAREAPRNLPRRFRSSLKIAENHLLQRVLLSKNAVLLPDVGGEPDWQGGQPFEQVRSWLGIPLLAAGRPLGVLSLGAISTDRFTNEHLRLAKNLAIPAAVAIQNARVRERAAIYATELEARLQELHETQAALARMEKDG